MKWRQLRGKLAIGAALVLFLAALWFIPSAPPRIHVTFLYTTNDPQRGTVGVFEFANQLDETVTGTMGYFLPAKQRGLSPKDAGWNARLPPAEVLFAARTWNLSLD